MSRQRSAGNSDGTYHRSGVPSWVSNQRSASETAAAAAFESRTRSTRFLRISARRSAR